MKNFKHKTHYEMQTKDIKKSMNESLVCVSDAHSFGGQGMSDSGSGLGWPQVSMGSAIGEALK